MASYVPPEKNAAFVFYVSLESQAAPGTFQANPTLAAGDVKVATDDGAPANLGTLPAVDADFTKRVKVSLSAAEMNGDNVTVIFSDAAGAEWYDLTVNLQTATNQIDDLATAAALAAGVTVASGGITSASFANSSITANSIASNAIAAAKIATGAITSTKFAAGAIDASAIASNAITGAKILDNAITDLKIADGALTALKFATGAITAGAIATDAIDADAIAADAVTEIQSGLATAAAVAALNNLSAAQVNAEVDTALADIHLDHLLAADYDPASKPGVATALLNELIENDGGVSRYTANALEQGPGATADEIVDALEAALAAVSSVTVVATVSGATATVYQYATWDATFTLSGSPGLTGYENLIFGVKRYPSDTDAQSVLYVNSATGLIYIGQAAATGASFGSLMADSATQFTVYVDAAEVTSKIANSFAGSFTWSLKGVETGTTPDEAIVIAEGTWRIEPGIVRSIT